MKKLPSTVPFSKIFRLGLSIFLLLAILLTAFIGPLIYSFEKHRKAVIVAREAGYLEATQQFFHTKLFEAYADIGLLANLPALTSYIENPTTVNRIKLEQYFSEFIKQYTHYDKVRFIDTHGQELVRVNYQNGKAVVIAAEALQNKADRYYFREINQLQQNERYISRMDLNMEHGQIETPYKPIIRFAMPVFDQEGTRKGAIVINYLSAELLNTFRSLTNKSGLAQSMLLNNEGYWLSNTRSENERSFMFDKKENNIANEQPDLWRFISARQEGQIETEEGLYLFSTFDPTSITQEYVQREITHNADANGTETYSWKIIHLIPKNSLYKTSFLKSNWGLTWTLVNYFVLAVLSWLIASFRLNNQRYTRQLLAKDKRLSEINQRNVLATDSANIGIWELDCHTNKLIWDDWMHRLYQISPDDFNNSLESWENTVHPDDKTNAIKEVEKAINEKKPFHAQFRILQPSGEIRWIKADAIVIYDETDSASRMIGTNRDITQQINSESQIKQTLKDLNEAQRLAHIGSWSLNLESSDLQWSDEIYNLFEIDKTQVKASYKLFLSAIHPEDRNEVNQVYLQSVIDHKLYDIEHRLLFPDGRIKYVHERGLTLYADDGSPRQSQGTVQDITERKLAEQKNSQLLKIIEESPDFIGTSDLQGNLLYHNSAARRMVGLTDDEDLSKLHIKDMHPAKAAKKVFDEGLPAVSKSGHWQNENALLHRDGHEIPVLQTLMLHRDEKGKPALLSTIMRDITDSKRIEKELLAAKQNAEKANQAKSIFLANMSHEIRTPIHATMGLLKLLSDTALTTEQHHYLLQAQDSIHILLNLLNNILDISKIESGKLVLEKKPIQFQKFLSLIQSTMQPQAKQKGIALKLNHSSNLPEWVVGDYTRLMQVLINLIANAIKFTSKGNVTFSVRAFPFESTWRITFDVSDTGIGIPQDKIKTIFEPFTQAESGIARKYGGTGLGLAISKRIVDIMGSQLHVQSSEDEGSRFYFTLVLPEASADSIQREQINKSNISVDLSRGDALSGKQILLVEDNPALQEMTRLFLEKQGAIVKIAGNGREALDLIDEHPTFNLVLMDIQMPIMGGHEAANIIRKSHSSEQLPIIAMTASALKKDREAASAAGMNDYIVKPIDLGRLVEILSVYTHRVITDATNASSKDRIERVEAEESNTPPLIDFDLKNALSRMNDMPAIYVTIAKQFLDEYPGVEAQLHQLLADENFNQAARLFHRLKGSASQLGATKFTTFLTNVESRVNSGLIRDEVTLLQAQFDQQFEETVNGLKEILKTLENKK